VKTATPYISEFGTVLLFIITGVLFVIVALFFSRLIRPNRPGTDKLKAYESGEEPVGPAWTQFNIRFYIVALVFLLFEVEIIFLFPWATVFADAKLIKSTNGVWGWFALVEALVFILILALGLVYAWVKGHLDWIKPNPQVADFKSPIPKSHYEKINERYARKNSADERTA
jgi:NADH-quinone oxidoreductase subunit A